MSDIIIPDAGYINGIAQEARINTLSEDQEKALDFVDKFMKSDKKYTVIGGCAGVGKSTIIPYIVQKYDNAYFSEHTVEVCSYTGKAVMVLKRKGMVDAKTLHSLLYRKEIEEDKETGEKTIKFVKMNPMYLKHIKLLIIDEASMISKEMFNYISTFPFKTIYIGDHFQLPPIGDNFNIMEKVDFKMEKILRQNEDNPIIKLADMARRGEKIPLGIYGKSKHTLIFDENKLLEHDEILTWTNKCKDAINDIVRSKRGFEKDIPHVDDKMIVKANAPSKQLFNGQIVYLMSTPKLNKNGSWSVELIDELAYNDPFIMAQTDAYIKAKSSIHLSREELDKIKMNPFINIEKKKGKKNNNPFDIVPHQIYQIHLDWGYAITCYSAQGSSWNNVGVILENRLKYMENYNRWLYTAITRAEESVTLYSGDFSKYTK